MLIIIAVVNIVYLSTTYYLKNTHTIPVVGGEYTEAMVGQPRFINPVLSPTNDIDADLTALVYSSLLKIDSDGNLQNDATERYEISEDKLTYTFYLKPNIKWHNGEKLTAHDVAYTIKTIQNEKYYSPLIANWQGIKTEVVNDHTINFILKNAYTPFLNNLTFGILPKHLWESIGPSEFPLSEINYQPIGSGPYKLEHFKKDKNGKIISIELLANKEYYNTKPYLKKIIFTFFSTEQEAITAFNKKEVKGINYVSPNNIHKIVDTQNQSIHRLNIPRYYAIFFNQTQSKILANKQIRTALAHAINKDILIEQVLNNEGKKIDSPIPFPLIGHNPDIKQYEYNPDKAKQILEDNGWKDSDNDGIREKDGNLLTFNLVSTNWPDLEQTATTLKTMWKDIGVEVNIQITDNIQDDFLKDRNYEAVLFGEILNYDPDPFAFWHSSQKKDPGLNLALYDNPAVDKILEETRTEINLDNKISKYQEFQNVLIEDLPAIFLYSPNYLYLHDKTIKGTNVNNIVIPSDRFNDLPNWFLKTKKIYKK